MLYQCTRCGKEFSSDESLSFCPFCGSPYAAAQPEHQVITQRVVIGTDGERAVQEKYWKATQNVLDRMMQNLRYSLPRFSQERPDCDEEPKAPKELSEKKLDIHVFLSLSRVSSVAEFRMKLNRYLQSLQKLFDTKALILSKIQTAIREKMVLSKNERLLDRYTVSDFEDDYSIRVKEEKQFIDDFCVELAKAINCPSIDPLRPLLKYDPQNDDWSGYDEDFDEEEEDAIPDTLDDYDRLLKVIFEARNALIKIVEENSTFILEPISNVATEVEEEAFHPLQYIPRLQQLMLEDYDPIFGKTPDEFLTVFSEAVYQLSFFIMTLPTYDDWIYRCPQENLPYFRQLLDEYKLQTLKAYIDDWTESLQQELDKAYQEQRLDMLSVFQRIDKLLKS